MSQDRAVGDLMTSLVRLDTAGAPTASPLNVSYRVGRIADLLSGRWLDLGCADGGYTAELLRRGATEVIGVDAEQERVAQAAARNLPHASFQVAHSEHLPFPDAHFDGVFMNEVFEHVSDEARPCERSRVSSPRRYARTHKPESLVSLRGPRYGDTFLTSDPVPLLPWLPQSLTNRLVHARNYWPRQLVDHVEEAGLTVESCEFIWPVFEQYPWLPEYLRKRYQAHIRFFDQTPGLRRFGVSTLVVGRRPESPEADRAISSA